MPNLIADFAAQLIIKARADVPTAQQKFSQDPGAFRRWCAELLQNFRGQLTTGGFLQWVGENPAEVQRAIDAEAPAALRELDRILLEAGAVIDRAYQAAEAARRPEKPSLSRRPPSAEELFDQHFGNKPFSHSESFSDVLPSSAKVIRAGRR